MHNFRLIFIASLLAACSSTQSTPENAELAHCPEQRPQICTMDYRPVCATRDTGVRCITTPCPATEQKTYSNACSACADQKVISYVADECIPVIPEFPKKK